MSNYTVTGSPRNLFLILLKTILIANETYNRVGTWGGLIQEGIL
jgi:hypothetical protein